MVRNGNNFPLAYLGFAVVKFLGYYAFIFLLERKYHLNSRNPYLVALFRTCLGIVLGTAWFFLMDGSLFRIFSGSYFGMETWVFFFPVKIFEWWLTFRIFYGKAFASSKKGWIGVFVGTIVSYILDIPAAMMAGYAGYLGPF